MDVARWEEMMTGRCLVLFYLSGVTAFSVGKTLHGSTEQLAHPAWTLLAGGEVNLKGK